ncbi:toll-like receptor 4 [Saccostrea echinata]|uniref:toll-like receptor 4 n=1 Tax=Saccostrea echinata TaxID=191078 RepID=UPI002A823F23|nr:toll-like receptor 4 [Saccostrea echinata]
MRIIKTPFQMRDFGQDMQSLMLILICNFAFLYGHDKQFNCSTERNCLCIRRGKIVLADCSRLNLKRSPNFTNDVTRIDLGYNLLEDIPSNLPFRLTHLNVTKNLPLKRIRKDTLRENLHLQHLVLSYCNLKEIERGTFEQNGQLEHLDLSNNPELTLSVMTNITFDLQNSKIKTLLLDKLHCTYGVTNIFRYEYTKYLSKTNLKTLSLASNRISFFENQIFKHLPDSLEVLNVGDNTLSFGIYLFLLHELKGLKILNASFQDSFHLQDTIMYNCNDSGYRQQCLNIDHEINTTVSYGNLWNVENSHHSTSSGAYIIVYLPPNIEKIYFHDNMFKMELHRYDFNVTNRKLTHLFLQNNIFYKFIGPLKGLQSVQYLDLSNNLCTDISPTFFVELNGILYLNVSQNLLGSSLQNDYNGDIFQNLTALKVLDLSENRLRNLPRKIFRNMCCLSVLYLNNNALETFIVELSHMNNLSKVDLSNNQISTIGASVRSIVSKMVGKNRHFEFNLLQNPIHCTCENLDFLEWMLKSKVIFPKLSEYKCVFANASDTTLQDLAKTVKNMRVTCDTYLTLIVITTLVLFTVLTIITTAILNRYRWRLRYLFYLAKRRYTEVQYVSKEADKLFRYDAFISYAEEDKKFIFSKLDYLEKEKHLRLCLHSRDFIPGTDIADNIANAIHNSRRTMCVLTCDFLKSYWCMYELNMARMESIYSRDGESVILIIILKKNVVKSAPLKIIDLFESQSYLEYPENESEVTAFWTKICDTLYSTSVRR